MIPRWIGRNVNVEISNEACEALSSFTLMWHFVERKFKERRIINNDETLNYWCMQRIIFSLQTRILCNAHLETSSRYFQRRYAAGGEGNFDGLSHRDFEIETARRISLMLQRPRTVAEHARCVAYICWRMRNNIFHGNKNFNEIATQADLINAAAEGLQGIAIALGLARDFED